MTSSVMIKSEVAKGQAETLAWRFAAVCGRFGGRTAVTLDGASWTYAELDEASDRVAAGLSARGAGVGGIVAICLERSFSMIAVMLGVVKCGAAYLPIDPAYPAARIAETIADAAPVVVVNGALAEELMGAPGSALGAAAAGDPAYVIYTSGSTGRPKGVVVTHANVLRLMDETAGWFGFGERDVWTMFHSFAFDFSVWEIWGALLTGGRLVMVPFAVSRSPEDFRALLVRERVTVLNQTPSAFALLDAVDAEAGGAGLALRVVVFGGEALALGSLRGWFGRHGDETPEMVNMYGITETTVHVTYRRVRVRDLEERESLIGVAIPDMQVWLLDEELRSVADGEVGEICVGGGGVALGYLNRPELTAEKFVAGLYRSGDMGRRRADGELVYLGRRDSQVKISGYRIELGEVEAAVAAFAGVRQACVVARDGRLEGFVVGAVDTAELSGFVASRLPGHMRPSGYRVVASLPLTVNGKVDREALVAAEVKRETPHDNLRTSSFGDHGAPVAAAWEEVLGHAVGIDENFFDVGGTSLRLIALRAKLRERMGREIPLMWMFECTTVRAMAERLAQGAGVAADKVTAAEENALRQKQAFARARAGRSVSK